MVGLFNDSKNWSAGFSNSSLAYSDIIPSLAKTTGYLLLTGLFGTIGTVGNFLFMLSFFIEKKMRTVSNYFIFMLALIDFFGSQILVLGSLGVTGRKLSAEKCNAVMTAKPMFLTLSMFSQLLISMDRCCLIRSPIVVYRTWFNKKLATVYSVSGWILNALVFLLIYIFGEHPKQPREFQCMFSKAMESIRKRAIYTYCGVSAVFFFVSIVCYSRLILHVRRQTMESTFVKGSYVKTTLALLSLCVFSFLTIFLCSLLLYLSITINSDIRISNTLNEGGNLVAFCGLAANPFFYGYRIKTFRDSVRSMFRLKKINRVTPSETERQS